MKMGNGINKKIYSITQKPSCYREVKNPPKTDVEKLARPQDARQMQYNKWSKAHQIYSGSYMPYRAGILSKQGWITLRESANPYETEHIRKSTKQHVLRHGRHINKSGNIEPTHYHWKNPYAKTVSKKQGGHIFYFDKYGEACARGSMESHLKPFRTRRKKNDSSRIRKKI